MTGPSDGDRSRVNRGRSIGRARVRNAVRPRRPARPGVARGKATPKDPETAVFARPDPTAPVFVDSSGRRGRRLRRVTYLVGGIILVLLAAWWLSQVFLTGWSIG
jgi:hypothetical protein